MIRYPALPLLADFLNTLLIKAAYRSLQIDSAIEGIVFNTGTLLHSCTIHLRDVNKFESSLEGLLEESMRRYQEMKTLPVTAGPSGDTNQFGMIASRSGIQLSGKEGSYEQLATLYEGLLSKRKRVLDILSAQWDISAKEKILLKQKNLEEEKGYPPPSILKSVSLYEGGRFFGLRDEGSGSINKGTLKVRFDSDFWLLSLISPGVSLVKVINLDSRDRAFVFVNFEPIYGLKYGPGDLEFYGQFSEEVERFVSKTGLFMEEEELFRLSMLLHLYSKISSPMLGRTKFCVKLRAVRPVGRRFNELFISFIHPDEISALSEALGSIAVEDARSIAESCSRLGAFIIQLTRGSPAIARELNLDGLIPKLKILLTSLAYPGYSVPTESLYDLVRVLKVDEWRSRFIGLLARRIQEEEGTGETEAREKARRYLDKLIRIVENVIAGL